MKYFLYYFYVIQPEQLESKVLLNMADRFLIKLILFFFAKCGLLLSFLILSTASVSSSDICEKFNKQKMLSALEDLIDQFKTTSEIVEQTTSVPLMSTGKKFVFNYLNFFDTEQYF